MAVYEISNGKITVSVDSRGAEMRSLRRIDTGEEYMWSGNPEYWGKVSPLLFPLVGTLKGNEYCFGGKAYAMGRHGFARYKEFKLVSQVSAEMWLALEADEETRKIYPFDFRLEVGYRLEGMRVKVLWRVENPSDEPVYFSIGGHPAFRCPFNSGEDRSGYYLDFDGNETIQCTRLDENGLISERKVVYKTEGGMLPVREELFCEDAMIMENGQLHSIALLTPEKKPYIRVEFAMPVVAVWTPAGKNAPFICIEPWYGTSDSSDFAGTWEERKWGNKVEPGKRFAAEYTVDIG